MVFIKSSEGLPNKSVTLRLLEMNHAGLQKFFKVVQRKAFTEYPSAFTDIYG
jgi:hypothetical protein